MGKQAWVSEQIQNLFKLPENRENLEWFYKFLSNTSRGFSLCQVISEDQQTILNFFKSEPWLERIHGINMVELTCDTMKLQQTIIDANKKNGTKKDIFFIYNLEGCMDKFDIDAGNFFQGLNLIRDFFMHFQIIFVFFFTESSQKKLLKHALDFYDWIKFTFTFVPEEKKRTLQPIEIERFNTERYSNPLKKIKYLENSLEKITDAKEKSLRLLELAALNHQVERNDRAMEQVRQSLEIEESQHIEESDRDWNGIAKRYALMGLIYKSRHELDKALEFSNKAAEIVAKGNLSKDLALAYSQIASIYRDKNNPDKELEFEKKTLTIFEKNNDMQNLAISYSIIGRTHQDIGDLNSAIKSYRTAVEIFDRLDDLPNLAAGYNNLGVVYQAQGHPGKALEAIEKALALFEQSQDQDKIETVKGNISKISKLKGEQSKWEALPKPTGVPFNWDKLLRQIKNKTVIPVIGPGLYRVEIESEGKTDILLYDYLAQQVSEACDIHFDRDEPGKFPKACTNFLKKYGNDSFFLSTLLMQKMEGIHLLPGNWLNKLARIRGFDFFMNTTYDNLFLQMLKKIRTPNVTAFFYTKQQKLYKNSNDGSISAVNPNIYSDLVFHLFGSFENKIPAYTPESIVHAILSFPDNIEHGDLNFTEITQRLSSRQLLFLGFSYDDWLFLYLICILGSLAFKKQNFKLLLENIPKSDVQNDSNEFLFFLEKNDALYFYPTTAGNFIDLLFDEIKGKFPEEIIPPEDFPGTVFISFEVRDRSAARQLAYKLREDGIAVWLDEDKLGGGEQVIETVIKAINRCSVFIPLISRFTVQKVTEGGELKFHIQEWEQALSKYSSDNKSIKIIPVVLDNMKNIYPEFRDFNAYIIPNGTKGEYERLKEELKHIQGKYHD